MVDLDTTFEEEFFDVAVGEAVPQLPPDHHHDHLWREPEPMTIARHRQVMATVADAIVTAAAGSGLRVMVDGGFSETATFADHLTQALHMRGRACRCLLSRPSDNSTPGGQPGPDDTTGAAAAVIIDGTSGAPDSDPCRIHIQIVGPAQNPKPAEGQRPCIVVDYLDPDGPTIRRIEPPCAQ